MRLIKQWIICILIGAFIVNIVDMLLPKSKLKPYINLVCNFMFVFIVISPIISFLSKGSSLEDNILKSMNDYNKKYIESSSKISQDEKTINLNKEYEDSLKDVIRLKLENSGYELEDIEINGTEIESLKIKENKSDDKSIDNETSEVFKNETDKNKQKDKEADNKEKDNEKDKDKLKDDMVKILDISVDKIEID